MSDSLHFTLEGTALPRDAARMLDEICEHFVEHAEVRRTADAAVLKSHLGTAVIRHRERELLIDLACPSETSLQLARTSIAEHLFYFAANDPLELNWSRQASRTVVPNLHEVTVAGAENVTPRMRRVRFACADVAPFIGGDMHVRILVPPRGRQPVWPGYRKDGRIAWPDGEDKLLVRAYTIRAVDVERRELWIDFLLHSDPVVPTPGSDFAREARAGDVAALLGPGSGRVPSAKSILLIGDESGLPAIARIASEMPSGTSMRAIVEVSDAEEEQPLGSTGKLEVEWLHRDRYPAGAAGTLTEEGRRAIACMPPDTFVWAACEKNDARVIRSFLDDRRHDRRRRYVAWYWDK